MTNHWIDIKNADAIMIMGSNAAENHPISFKWVTKAMEDGAKLISVDPRFTRTSSKADLFAQIRPGTDIPFTNGLIRYAIENELYNDEYVKVHTNALCKIKSDFEFDDVTGLFSGYDSSGRKYDKSTWQYQLDADNNNVKADSLDDPECVFAILKNHVARYTPEKISSITGVTVEKFNEIAAAYCATGARDKVGTIMYAMGWTQHTTGVQNIRAFAILQLLLGNMGLAGGGVNALRGESNVQGSTDHCILYHILPGYLACPTETQSDLDTYIAAKAPATINPGKSTNWWQHYKKYMVSLLKDYYGENATADNDFAYSYLPKRTGDNSHIALFESMNKGTIKGMIAMGQNPAVGGPNADFEIEALGKLDWMIVADLWETETAAFWKRPGVDPKDIDTEVFLLPAAASVEKEGSITNSGRWSQWRYKAIDPPGEARSDLWILWKLGDMLKKFHRFSLNSADDPIKHLDWDYSNTKGNEEVEEGVNVHEAARRINGYFLEDTDDGQKGELVPKFTMLTDDGKTSSANWLYCASYTEDGNMAARRDITDTGNDVSGIGLYSNFSWCWPVNRRIIYNRASCDAAGNPWNEDKKVIWYDGEGFVGGDVRDSGNDPTFGAFIMKPEGLGRIFGMGRADGPLPEHYEPMETPLATNPIGTSHLNNPCVTIWPGSVFNDRTKYPYVATTYRMVEHWQAGAMTRNLPWLAELVPDMFVEISETLAADIGVVTGEMVRVYNERGSISCFVLVTNRIKTLTIEGKACETIGIPWHFGYEGLATGDSANVLTPHVGDPNTTIPEFKAFLVNIEKL
jgi:formate dehydrogenase major subunit